jgi:ankyrin repeat protein
VDEQLTNALFNDDLNVMVSLLETGVDPNTELSPGRPLLFQAVIQGKTETAKLLIDYGADVHAETVDGAILVKAASRGHEEIVETLLEAGADANAIGKEGANELTSLFAAAIADDPEIVALLIKHGADINQADPEGNTPLCIATGWEPNNKTVNLLLENGANVNHQNAQGDTALHLAVRKGLVSNSFDIEIVRALIEYGAALDVKDGQGQTPLDIAGSDTDIGELLLAAGSGE